MRKFIKLVFAFLLLTCIVSCVKNDPVPLTPKFEGVPSISMSGHLMVITASLAGATTPGYHDCGFYLNDGENTQTIKAFLAAGRMSSSAPAKDYAEKSIMVQAFISNGLGNEILSSASTFKVPGIAAELHLPAETRMMMGDKVTLNLTTIPSRACDEIEWKSENTEVVQVDDKGCLTGVSHGVALVSAKSKDSGKEASSKVYVGSNYIDWIGDWKVNRGSYTDTWHVTMREYGSTYSVTGIEGEDYIVIADYNKDNTLSIRGDQFVGVVKRSGEQYNVHLHAEIDYSGETYWCNSNERRYQIFKAQIGSSGNASVVPQTFDGKKTGVQTIKRFRYLYTKSSSLECADTHNYLNGVATELPCTMTTVEPSTSSVSTVLAGNDGTLYQVRGRCKDISNTTYGNWYLDDGTGQIYIDGTLSRYGRLYWESHGISEGDMVTVRGYKRSFYGLVDALVVKIEK